tara:strand:+ start:323 stop:2914 length:2592 start_codon:yes stop_codon:yes gene_type:complete
MVKKSKAQVDAEKGAKETAGVVEDALRNIADKVGSIFQEALSSTDTVAKSVAKDITGSLNSLAKVSKDLASANTKAAEGAFKQADATKLIQQRQAKIKAINYQISMLGKGELKQKKALNDELSKVQNYNEEFEAGLQEQVDLSAKITKQMGLTGAALGGLKTIAGKLGLGSIGDAFENANSAALEVAKNSSGLTGKFKVLGAAIGSLGKSFIGFIKDPVAMIGLMVKGFQALLKLGQKFAQKTADIGKAFLGMNSSAKDVKNSLADMADSNLYLNFTEAKTALVGLNKVAGTSVMMSEKQIKNYQKYSHFLGLSEEATQGLFKVATLSGKEFGTTGEEIGAIVKGLNFSTKSAISMNDVMEEVASASATSIANIGSNPEALAKAAFQAKRLGMTLDQVAAAGETNLDFQSSIEKEMAAELLLGKNLNLEALRSASLRGDEVTVAKEMERILAANYDSTKGNKIQQKALADSLGISVDEMHKMNQTRLLQNKLGEMDARTREAAEKKVNQLMKEGNTRKQAIALLSKEELANTVKEGKTAEASQRMLEQAKGVLANSLAPLAAKVAKAIAKFANSKTFQKGLEAAGTLIGKVGDTLMLAIPMIQKLFGLIKDNPITALAGGAILGVGASMLKMGSAMNPMYVRMGKGGFGGAFSKIKSLFTSKGSKALTKASGKFSTKQIAAGFGGKAAKDQLAKQGGKMAGKTGLKVGAKLGVKAVGKSLLKKIPVIGLLAGVGFGIQRAMKGDFAGAALELASGAASTIPGLGTAASVAIDAGLAAKDYKAATGGGSTAADFISRPGQPIQKFRKDDIIVGGTSLGSGGGGNNGEVVALLKELISEVRKGGDVFMDGNKVGKSLALVTSRMG